MGITDSGTLQWFWRIAKEVFMHNNIRGRDFFIIDRDHLDQVKTKLYGYLLDETGITSGSEYSGEIPSSDDCGAYVIVRRLEDEITIEQDFFGKYGLYLFESEGYYAISNSFLYLVDYLKHRYPLSMDTEYADYLLVSDLVSTVCGRTMIREIRLLDRNSSVHISLRDRTLTERINVPPIRSVNLDSEEGIRILDRWYDRWTRLFRNVINETSNISADLSGGMDSRVCLMLLLGAGVDLNKVNFISFDDDRHTHREDYSIACQIAEHYGFRLNDVSMLRTKRCYFTKEDALFMSLSVSLGFSKMMNVLFGRFRETRYRITGAGGEGIRGFWEMPVDDYVKMRRNSLRKLPKNVQKRYGDALEHCLRNSMAFLAGKYRIMEQNAHELPQIMHMEEWVRNHFGKDAVETGLVNDIKLSPLLDKDLQILRQTSDDCSDNLLLLSVIMNRYCPDLLQFSYDGGRCIAPETLEYGAQIAASYPMTQPPMHKETRSFVIREKSEECSSKKLGKSTITEEYWKWYHSDAFEYEFRLYAGVQMDRALRKRTLLRTHNPLYDVYAQMAVVRIMHAVWESRDGLGSEGMPDRPLKTGRHYNLRLERKMLRPELWLKQHIYWRLRKLDILRRR